MPQDRTANIIAQQKSGGRGPEYEQAIVRLVFVAATVIYFHLVDGLEDATRTMLLTLGWSYTLLSAIYFAWIVLRPDYHFSRQMVCNLGDTVLSAYPLLILPETGAPFFFALIWLPIGNGFRYGQRSLVISYLLALLASVIVIGFNPFWRQQSNITLGFMLLLTVVPIYVSVLVRRLELALDKAEAASKTKSLFLANMSHELRTPLNAIIGYSELLYEEAQEQQLQSVQRDLQKIKTAGSHLLTLINDILDISKIEAGKFDLERNAIQVGALIEEVLVSAGDMATDKTNTLEVDNQIANVTLHTDRQKLKQVLINILGNACKFTDHGKVVFRIYSLASQGVPRVVFEVCDTGIGMSSEQMARIFTPFTQIDPSSTRRYQGTGLGLAISRHFVEMMGGRIEVQSEPGQGSCFWVSLPMDAG